MGLIAVSCSTSDRDQFLKVYNWSSYIDEDLIGEFEEWYEQQTGEPVTIIYQTFDINESMLAKIEKGHEDYDVVCPSDYMIERMLREDLLLPIERDFGDTPNYIDGSTSKYIKNCFDDIDGNGRNANDYSVGYMWGTTGILYNTNYVTEEEASTWNVIRNPKFAGKILIKDAARDVYAPVLIYLRRDEIAAGKTTIKDLMFDCTDESLSDVEEFMAEVKPLVAGWEADFGKEQMTQEKAWINFTWSGDAVWAIEEAADVDVPLAYAVPREGSTVWFDGWVIPKYAKNRKAAQYFINFMCMPENAIRNSDETGYVSANGAPEVLEAMIDSSWTPVDLRYFFSEADSAVCVDPALYPDQSVIDMCAMEHDSGDRTKYLLEMWARVKGDNATAFTYIVIFTTLALLVFGSVYKKVNKLRRKRQHKAM